MRDETLFSLRKGQHGREESSRGVYDLRQRMKSSRYSSALISSIIFADQSEAIPNEIGSPHPRKLKA